MLLSTAMMPDWLGEKHDHQPAVAAAERIDRAVKRAFATGLKPFEFGGQDGTATIANAVLKALD